MVEPSSRRSTGRPAEVVARSRRPERRRPGCRDRPSEAPSGPAAWSTDVVDRLRPERQVRVRTASVRARPRHRRSSPSSAPRGRSSESVVLDAERRARTDSRAAAWRTCSSTTRCGSRSRDRARTPSGRGRGSRSSAPARSAGAGGVARRTRSCRPASRFGHGMSTWPRPAVRHLVGPVAVEDVPAADEYVRSPPPTSTTTARWSLECDLELLSGGSQHDAPRCRVDEALRLHRPSRRGSRATSAARAGGRRPGASSPSP